MKLKSWLREIFAGKDTVYLETLKKHALALNLKWVKVFRGKECDDAYLKRLVSEKYVVLNADGRTVSMGPKIAKPKTAEKVD